MPAQFTLPTIVVIPAQVITASLWNNEFSTIYNNFDPFGMNDYSNTDVQMQTAVDPYPGSVVSRPTSLQGELERLRYTIAGAKGTTYWYQPPVVDIATFKTRFDAHTHSGAANQGPQITAAGIANSTITETQLATSIAGNGLAGGAGTALSVNVDNATIEISSDILRVKALGITNSQINDVATTKLSGTISNAQLAAGAVTDAKVTDVGGSKITGTVAAGTVANTSIVSVDGAKITGTVASGTVASGSIVSLDGSKITGTVASGTVANASLASGAVTDAKVTDVAFGKITGTVTPSANTVTTAIIQNNAVTADKIATSVAGDGLSGGGGTALSVNVDGSTIETNSDTLRVKDAGVTEAKLATAVVNKLGQNIGLHVTNVVANSGLVFRDVVNVSGQGRLVAISAPDAGGDPVIVNLVIDGVTYTMPNLTANGDCYQVNPLATGITNTFSKLSSASSSNELNLYFRTSLLVQIKNGNNHSLTVVYELNS
jgi:hypothetical protein